MKKSEAAAAVSRLRRRYRATRLATSVFRYFFLLAVGYVIVFQLAYMFSYAFRPAEEMTDPSVVWVPRVFTLANFKESLQLLDYVRSLFTTVGIQLLSGMIEVVTCSLVAYGLARFRFRGRGLIFALVLLTILVPPQLTAVPMYLNYAHFDVFGILNLIGSIAGTPPCSEPACVPACLSLFTASFSRRSPGNWRKPPIWMAQGPSVPFGGLSSLLPAWPF